MCDECFIVFFIGNGRKSIECIFKDENDAKDCVKQQEVKEPVFEGYYPIEKFDLE